ncbi:MAG: TolC family protein [Reichenbachiella sp.]|uniref:TolC family protein n=1 Tax=Reichenbachiella sp. TaxID=2184521 RepID=UPI003296EAAE
MKIWLIPLFTLFCFPVVAQLQFNSLDELLKYADKHAIALQTAAISEQTAIANAKESSAYLFPTLNASAGYNDNITLQATLLPAQLVDPTAPEGTYDELTFGKKHAYSAGVNAQWDILNFQKSMASQTAKILVEESKVNTQRIKFNTYNQLVSIYYSIVLTQEALAIYEENLRVATAIYESAKEKYQEGIIEEAKLNAAAIQKLSSRSILGESTDNVKSFYIQLQSLLNTQETVLVQDSPEHFMLANTKIQTLHPEILWQQVEVKKSESLLKQKKALHLPSASIFYQYNYNWATDNFFSFDDVSKLPQQFVGIKLNIPVFNGFSTRQKIILSQHELQLQELQLKNTKLVKQKEDDLLLLDSKKSAQLLADHQQMLDLQQQNDAHAENKYKSGIISLDERLDKYEDLLKMQNNYLQSLASLTLSHYKIYIRQIDFTTYE